MKIMEKKILEQKTTKSKIDWTILVIEGCKKWGSIRIHLWTDGI